MYFKKINVEITFMYFKKINVEITFMYFTDGLVTWKIRPLLKSLSCISQNHLWNHFHVFHKNQCWNHFHVFHRRVGHLENKTIGEITFMYFTKINVEITFMYFTDGLVTWKIRPLLKSLSCISQNQCWNHFHVFYRHVGHLENKTIAEITFMYFTDTLVT